MSKLLVQDNLFYVRGGILKGIESEVMSLVKDDGYIITDMIPHIESCGFSSTTGGYWVFVEKKR